MLVCICLFLWTKLPVVEQIFTMQNIVLQRISTAMTEK
ncbi:hypothetical protein BACOVA_00439 [Bacteroides ovatus ATCC 8483]|uniref:Uncharacterized protein n=1 Tax=Bacteroides ovatus (strain ATCC 8483 / DSM 1896 / JCM 5824 / BCRC 10623 / CCUG 4943 / NCTC 11153) TaxID=411476 RepID=A0AAN3AC20_BACO1|nr:hypothetical protein BACOVA_00439 [Bacteroides ovatus ATCC 8483]